MVFDWKQPAQEQEIPCLDYFDVAAERCWGGPGVRYQDPATGAPHRRTADFPGLPSARVRTAIHVQHLPRDVTSFR